MMSENMFDPWQQPLPWEVAKQYLLDEIEFYEAEKQRPQKATTSVKELMRLSDEEIQQIESDETD